MATWVYPPLPPQQLEREADSALVYFSPDAYEFHLAFQGLKHRVYSIPLLLTFDSDTG